MMRRNGRSTKTNGNMREGRVNPSEIWQAWMFFDCSRQNLILESFLSASTVYSLTGVEMTDKIMT